MTLTFGQSQKPPPERAEFGTCWKWRQSLARSFFATCWFCMPFWVVIRRLTLTVLEKPRPLKKIWWICLLLRSSEGIRHPGINWSRGCDNGRECSSGAVWRTGESLGSLRYHRYYEKGGNQRSIDTAPEPPPNIRSSKIPQPYGLSTGQTVAVSWWGDAVWRLGLEA